MNTSKRYSPEVRDRAVRMVLEQRKEHSSQWATIQSIASINVLKDIQKEFEIQDMDIKTPGSYTREELTFDVIDDDGNKYQYLLERLNDLNEKHGVFVNRDIDSKCGIIFTPFVNGDKGCYQLAEYRYRLRLQASFQGLLY